MDERALEGRNAVITGAGRGLGRAMALALAGAGARVALVARTKEQLDETARLIREGGGVALTIQADVTNEEEVQGAESLIRSEFGRIQILINNAGMNIRKPLTEFSLAEWRQVLDTNLTSVFLMCRAFVPGMTGQGYGRILHLTSMMSHVALPGRTAYCASKTGLLGFIRALALELAPEKITVNGISPGPFATEINTPLLQDPKLHQQFTSRIPLGRWGEVGEVGSLALYLCSEQAGFITGTDLVIDGGWTAQ